MWNFELNLEMFELIYKVILVIIIYIYIPLKIVSLFNYKDTDKDKDTDRDKDTSTNTKKLIEGNRQDLFNAVSHYITTLIDKKEPISIVNLTRTEDYREDDENENEEEEDELTKKDKENNIRLHQRLIQDYKYKFIYKQYVFYAEVIKVADKPIQVSHSVNTLLQNLEIETDAPKDIVDEFIKECNEYFRNEICNIPTKTKNKFHTRIWKDDYWEILNTVNKRDFNTVYLESSIKKEIIDKISCFISKKEKEKYKYLGITHKLNMLLEGPPGTGKTTTIKAIASYLNYDINVLTFDVETTDAKFMGAIKNIRNKSILVLEDIDCLFVERKTNDTNKNMITFSSLLNSLDGLTSKEGLIIIMTSNFKNNLDEALIRPGRIDKIIHYDYIKKEQVEQMYMKFIFCSENMVNIKTTSDEIRNESFESFYTEFKKLRINITCSLMQQYLFQYVDNQDLCLENICNIKTIHQDTKKEKANMYM